MRTSLILGVLASWFLAATSVAAKPLRIVTTTSDLASLVKAVGGDEVQVQHLAKGYQNPHFVEAKPSLMVKLMKADGFVQTGLDLEVGWVSLLLQGSRNKKVFPGGSGYIDASETITPMEVPTRITRAEGDIHPGGNPHYMMDPENAFLVVDQLTQRLTTLRPSTQAQFEENAERFKQTLTTKIQEWKKALDPYRGTPYVSYHKDWSYFARFAGHVAVGEVEPKPGIPPSPSHTTQLIERMKEKQVKLILVQVWFEKRIPDLIAKETGARVVPVALFPGEYEGIASYIDMIDYNVRVLTQALSKS